MSSDYGSIGSSTSSRNRTPTTFTIPDPNSVEEFGRTYHGYREGKYHFPNDGDEQDRLDIQHQAWQLMLKGRQYLAPIENPRHAIDLAAGTGIWAILFARQYPDCNVIATELSMIQPLDNTPHNLTYLREDAEDPWIFEHRFDFVHLRGVATAFADHKAVMQQVFDNLEPGGWCEYDDYSFENVADPGSEAFVAASPATKYLQLLVQGLVKLGKDPWATRKYRRWMAEIGFVDIVEKQILCPVNGWPLDPEDRLLGHFTRLGGDKGILGSVKLMVAAGMPQEEIPAFLDIAVRSWTDPRYRAYSVFYVTYGRKPHLSSQKDVLDLIDNWETNLPRK